MLPALQPHFRIRLAVAAEDAEAARAVLDSDPPATTGGP
jgi:hypothetical protein